MVCESVVKALEGALGFLSFFLLDKQVMEAGVIISVKVRSFFENIINYTKVIKVCYFIFEMLPTSSQHF